MSAPLSYASHALNLDKNQAMPTQKTGGKTPAKKAASAANTSAAAAPTTTSPTPVKAPAEKKATAAAPKAAAVTSPVAAKAAAPVKAAAPKAAAPKKDEVVAAKASATSSTTSASTVAGERAPVAPRTFYSGYGMVKAVLSGDSIVLAGSATNPESERVITLTGVQAPKFGRGKNQVDEPYAWESREYLRKVAIGRQVQFTVQHTHAESGRDYGTVSLNGTDVATQMVKGGYVRVKTGKDGSKVHADKEALLAIEAEAINKGVGMHKKGADPNAHLRTIDWTPDVQALFAANKGKVLAGVVDQVRDGSTLRVELIHPQAPLKHTMITLNLSGVTCPRTPLPLSVLTQQHEKKKQEDASYKGKAPTKMEKAEPFAEEAQIYTETRLLNRDVKVHLQGVDKSNNLFGSIDFAKGNITAKLLESGLGKLVPWSAGLTADPEALKAAEASAKEQKLRLWSLEESPTSSSSSSSSASVLPAFEGRVISVPSSDSIMVENAEGKEVRIWLASVRAPRLAGRGKDGKDEPYAQEAKELLRSKLVGHKVRVQPEYVRADGGDDKKKEPRTFATVFQNKMNVNEGLIAAGFAEAMQHRMDEARSQYYDVYLAAETKAKEAQRGKWDPREHVVTRITDLTERVRLPRSKKPAPKKASPTPADGAEADAEEETEQKQEKATPPSKAETEALTKNKQLSAKAKQYLTFLQREKQVNAVVEFVFSASRFKLLVPKEHVLISFSLAGVRTPAPHGPDGNPDPLATEVLNYVRSKIQQHSVKIEVETMDKADNYLGSLFHNRVNLAVDLLQQGYAKTYGFSAAKSPYSQDLYAAERSAKEARKGVWKDYVEPTPEEKAAAGVNGDEEESKESGPTDRIARITEIVDAGDFYVQWVGDKNAELVAKALAVVAEQPDTGDFVPPENTNGRSYVAAGQFSDDSWHRVRVDGKDANGDYNVYFIDFGNHDTLLSDRIRTLPAEAAKIPPLAVHAALAGLLPPKAPEYQEGSALAFSEMAFGIDLKATVEFTDKFGRKHLTLTHDSHPISVNRQLLRDGFAKVQQRPDRRLSKALLDALHEEQAYAKDHHYNLFEYGDVSDEEEGEKIAGPDPKARGQKPKPAGGKK